MSDKYRCERHDTDTVMFNTYKYLASDLDVLVGSSYFSTAIRGLTPIDLRRFQWYSRTDASPHVYKAVYQMDAFFKRYRFQNDQYTAKELKVLTLDKFEDTQKRISAPLRITPATDLVLRRARDIIKETLGKFSQHELDDQVRLGTRSTYGTPYRDSYHDLKFSRDILGSRQHLRWLESYLKTDHILAEAIQGKPWIPVDALALALVPKSYKSLRIVKPQTPVGNLYTNGLGALLTERLLQVGLNIRTLQERHKRLVKSSSKSRNLVTADLSAASDSITRDLLLKLLPYPWFKACMLGIARSCRIGKREIPLTSVATMGDGHTFPLQTLVFYSLIKAIGELVCGRQRFVSVYGDDLIYPTDIHMYVVGILNNLHFRINEDKTYVEGHFRESCGSDCYHGIDVRPCSIEGGYQLLSRNPYLQFLYKLYNGLRRRWDAVEIPKALGYIMDEIVRVNGYIHQVPPSFPDISGIKTDCPIHSDPRPFLVADCTPNTGYVFRYLRKCFDLRVVENELVYYWDSLRQITKRDSACYPESSSLEDYSQIQDIPKLSLGYVTRDERVVRFSFRKHRNKESVGCCLHKTRHREVEQVGSSSVWA